MVGITALCNLFCTGGDPGQGLLLGISRSAMAVPGEGAGNAMNRRKKPRILTPGFVREAKVSMCSGSIGFMGCREKGCSPLWQGWSSCRQGNPVEMFGISLNSAKQDPGEGQKLARPWRTPLHRWRRLFSKPLAWEVPRAWDIWGSERSEQREGEFLSSSKEQGKS